MTNQASLLEPTPGERLHTARRGLGLTRSDVAARLKCAEALVAALESDEPTGLAPVYERGFIKAYLRLLRLPETQAAQFMDSAVAARPEVRPVFPGTAAANTADRWLRAASYMLASLLVGTLAWQVAHEIIRISQVDQGADTAALKPVQTTESGTHVKASIAARPTAGAQAWQALENRRNTLAEGEYLLGIHTSADSWVEIRDDEGNILEQDLLRGGAQREYRGYAPFKVTLGRTSAVEFWVNGQPVDLAPFAREDVTQMILDPLSLPAVAPSTNNAD